MTKFGSDKIRTFGSDEGRQRIQDRRERVAAIRGDEAPRGRGKRRASSDSDTIELPTLEKLGRKLKRMDSADEIRAMQEQDDRKGAQELYEARLTELSGEGE